MASLSLHLMCPVCMSDFSDPVSLPCEHTFCRQCITSYLESSSAGANKCPECRQNFTKEDVKGNRALRNLMEAVQKQHQTKDIVRDQRKTPSNALEMLCSEHEEKLKLFCEDDQKLVCLICKDGEKHRGHSFKPVKEAMKTSENVVKGAITFISDENKQMGDMLLSQKLVITKSKERAKCLEEKMHAQFKKMHDFLREKEDILMRELQRAASSAEEKMQQNVSSLTELQKRGNSQVSILESGLKICQPEKFLEWWSEEGFPLVDKMALEDSENESAFQTKFRSRLNCVQVISDHFTLGPYETDLPLIVWRDILGPLKCDLEGTSTIDKDMKLAIKKENNMQSGGGNYFAKFQKFHNGYKDNYVEDIHNGQVFWEVDIGVEPGWEHGLTVRYYPEEKNVSLWQTLFSKGFEKISLLVKDNRLYAVRGSQQTIIVNQVIPSRVGVYVDCERCLVVFCNADNMSLIHTVWCGDKQVYL
ncbi:zinc-binding protein A33 [Myxocyprinus asiaticus]|uniref:zinc-binding protein A33 n=1 Tax=Myxocyprinus asiaticus TaxID=70543 RepID=UPI002223C70F|nr:zinc-binding protein A33 [Myxocyprinus asiaticus]